MEPNQTKKPKIKSYYKYKHVNLREIIKKINFIAYHHNEPKHLHSTMKMIFA